MSCPCCDLLFRRVTPIKGSYSDASTIYIQKKKNIDGCLRVQFELFLCPIVHGVALRVFRHAGSFFRSRISRSCSNFVSLLVCLESTHVLLVVFVKQFTNLVTPIQGSDDHRWFLNEVHQCWFSLVSGHQCNSEVWENRPSEQRFPPGSNMISILCDLS